MTRDSKGLKAPEENQSSHLFQNASLVSHSNKWEKSWKNSVKTDPGIRWHICDKKSHVVWNHCFYNKGNKTRKGDGRKERNKEGALDFSSEVEG